MLIGHFNEQPWQDASTGLVGSLAQLQVSNEHYNPGIGRDLYNRFIDEKLYAEEVGFEALMMNEHHSAPYCIQGVTNVELFILARQTSKAKLVPLGNPLPIWDDPLWLAESLAMTDMISGGRLISGFVRGGGPESISHNANTTYNRERFNEAHDFIIKTWTTPGPFRWEGKHHHFRYVNPWCLPLQKPHPPIWIPGISSAETVKWCAEHRYPYVMLATRIEPTKEMFDLYYQHGAEVGNKVGTQNVGYLFKVHVEETEDKGEEVGKKYIEGVANPFIQEGNEGFLLPHHFLPPGYSSRASVRKMLELFTDQQAGGTSGRFSQGNYESNVKNLSIISGTPKAVMPKVRHVLETLRPGTIFLWDGDGAMDHGDQVRSLRLHGQEVIPAIKEIAKELDLKSPYETNDGTGIAPAVWAKHQAAQKAAKA
ncbi:MAG: LLM class flavin-dependent oxidoreductase [Dehalococcoidia bacterium]|nr:LLM class flavin-dependent oxidoreductase [Dehalococcoidia bacterium]